MDQKTCEAKGFFWDPATQSCVKPTIGKIKLTLSRGASCGGGGRTRFVSRPGDLSESVKNILLRAAAKPTLAKRHK